MELTDKNTWCVDPLQEITNYSYVLHIWDVHGFANMSYNNCGCNEEQLVEKCLNQGIGTDFEFLAENGERLFYARIDKYIISPSFIGSIGLDEGLGGSGNHWYLIDINTIKEYAPDEETAITIK